MAHFAKISEDNIVLQVLTLNDSDMLDKNGNPSELVGQQYLEKHNNWPAHLWVQTSYNTSKNKHRLGGIPFRGNFAGIGYIWDFSNNIFIYPKIFPSFNLNVQTASYEAPVPYPDDGNRYSWNEDNQSWNLLTFN